MAILCILHTAVNFSRIRCFFLENRRHNFSCRSHVLRTEKPLKHRSSLRFSDFILASTPYIALRKLQSMSPYLSSVGMLLGTKPHELLSESTLLVYFYAWETVGSIRASVAFFWLTDCIETTFVSRNLTTNFKKTTGHAFPWVESSPLSLHPSVN